METKDTLSSCSDSEEQQMQQIQDKAKKSCMVSFRLLHSHLKLLSNNDLKGTRTECGFKRAFATLFGQDVETFTGTMFLNMDQLEKQLDKEEFQEIGSMAAFKYFLEYTQLEIREFRDTLIQHMESVKKSIDKRALHKREYDSRVNERQMQTTEEKVDTSKALDANIKPVYDEEPMAEVQLTAECNVFAIGQQHTEQPKFNNEGEVDQNAEQCHDKRPLPAKLTDNQIIELSNQSLESENISGSRDRPPMLATGIYAQWQSRFMRYVDTRPNGEALKKCILQGPYKHSHIIIPGQPATNESPEVPERTTIETFLNITPKNKAHYDAEKEAIHLLLTGIGDEIYSTVDACKTAHDMWIAIERLQQGESLNKQDVKTSLFWEFGRFTSRDGESIESYYSRFYKMMNEMIYKPTNNNLRTSSNSRNKNVDTSSRYKNDNQTGQFRNQSTVTVARTRETIDSQVVQQTGIQCFNCKEFRHFPKECRKPKRAKDYTYPKEKMLLCKQAEKGVPLQAEQADWLEDTDEEIDEQELEAHYSFMAKIQEVLPAESGSDAEPLEKVQYDAEYNVFANERHPFEQPESINDMHVVEKDDSNVILDSSNMCDNDDQADQNAEECDDERVVLANLIANLKLDTDENKKIQKQLKKANTSLSHELQQCKSALEECKSHLGESNRTRDRYLGALHDKKVELEMYKVFKDRTIEK
ncbi:retrovirus-related pol polyprotein from transposon TNT 1-94 [Tanacetum coccineum]